MIKRAYNGTEIIGNYLYLIGGFDEYMQRDSIQRLNLKTKEIELIQRMISGR
jgi:hypothetical protein